MTLSAPVSPAAAAVLDRIAEIEGRFDAAQSVASSTASVGASAGLLGGFGGVLDQALNPTPWTAEASIGSGSSSVAGSSTGQAILEGSMQYLGIPYRWGGTDPATGLDCSGFVQQAYEDMGIRLPRVSRQQATVGVEVPSLAQAQPGDLITFGQPVDHIGIFVGDNRMIVAPRTGDVVKIQEITRPIANIRRVVGSGGELLGSGASYLGASGPSVSSSSSASAATSRLAMEARLGRLGEVSAAGGSALPQTVPYAALFEAAGAKHGVESRLLASVAKVESNFNPNAGSPAGAQGLMQFMPSTAKGMGIDPLDPAQAIDGAARYLRAQMDRFGSVELALAAYNAGPGAVSRAGGIPPYAETRAYVPTVLSVMRGGAW